MPDVQLPTLLVTSSHSQFRLRVHCAAWSSECGGSVRRYATERDGLILLSATGPDTAVKAVRALMYSVDIECEFRLELEDSIEHLARASFDGLPCSYMASVARLAQGAIHLAAFARIPGLLPVMDDDRLWAELSGPRYTTPLLRPWVGWLKRQMIESGQITMADSHNAGAGILSIEPDELDALVSDGVRSGFLRMDRYG